MKCSIVRNQLLALESPREVPAALRPHLEGCDACRAWLQRALRVEASIRRLRVPAGSPSAKAALLETLRTPNRPRPAAEPAPSRARRLLEQYWHGGLIAATLLIGTVAFFQVGSRPSTLAAMPPDPLLQDMVALNLDLMEASTPAERLRQLGQLADQLYSEMRDLVHVDRGGENLARLAGLYHRVVLEGIADYAREIPVTQWGEVLVPLMERLESVAARTDALVKTLPAPAVEPLRGVALDAREAGKMIERLLKGRAQ